MSSNVAWCMPCQGVRDIVGEPRSRHCGTCGSGRFHVLLDNEQWRQARITLLKIMLGEVQAELRYLMGGEEDA